MGTTEQHTAVGVGRLVELLFVVAVLGSVAMLGGVAYDQTTATTTPVEVVEVNADPVGDDATNLQSEYVVVRNTGEDTLRLGSWQLTDGEHAYTFPEGVTLEPGETVTVSTGGGTDTTHDRYWGAGEPVWEVGETVVLTTADGERLLSHRIGPHGA
ncbi:lamin tail domain-containing protein [Halospeciosus flavus]|uniref:Lamin tail domain-containing protein n=1 Tax=Halospeciosus flavus TaxID=3032283 RepID=A0ABD5Z4G9_9EURY|nr:lamin tail domain-containing protein [Halospeciosus flavus]